jgi:hypothetical protein
MAPLLWFCTLSIEIFLGQFNPSHYVLYVMQSLSQEEWERASVYEVASTTALARMDENLDIELAGKYSGFFSKSIEKLKEASTVRLTILPDTYDEIYAANVNYDEEI